MDIHFVVQCVGEGEEAISVEEVFAIESIGDKRDLVFFGAGVQSRRGHDNFDYTKQSRRTIGISLVVR